MLWYLEECGDWAYTRGEHGAPIFPQSWLEMRFFHRLFLETPECRKATPISEGLVTSCSRASSRQLLTSREHSASVKSHTKSASLATTRSGVSDVCSIPRTFSVPGTAHLENLTATFLLQLPRWLCIATATHGPSPPAPTLPSLHLHHASLPHLPPPSLEVQLPGLFTSPGAQNGLFIPRHLILPKQVLLL